MGHPFPCKTAGAVCLRKSVISHFGSAATQITSFPGVPPVSRDIITIHPCNEYLTWFLQAFNRENHIWDKTLGYTPWGSDGGLLEDFQTICLFLFFIFYVKSMYLPVPQYRCCCQNYLCTTLISRAESHTPPFTMIINILYTKLPSEQETWQGAAAVSATSQLLDFRIRNGSFQSPWIFCSTMDILLHICFPLQGVGGRLGVGLGVCGDCFHCLSQAPTEAADSNGKSIGFGVSQICVHISAMSLFACPWANHLNLSETHFSHL